MMLQQKQTCRNPEGVDYDRIGERMYAELVYVNCGEGADAAKYTALVEKAAGLGRTLVLMQRS